MSDNRTHRGPHPQDGELFAAENLPRLCLAMEELSWLLSHGYAPASSLKLVGDRHQLRERQRLMVARAACSNAQRDHRRSTSVKPEAVAGRSVWIDGLNILITVEAALSRAVIFRGRDGCLRDLCSVHGSYRKVAETEAALKLVGESLAALQPDAAIWLLDSPVSNSGQLAQRIRVIAEENRWPWEVRLSQNPDRELSEQSASVIVSSDSVVLDNATQWLALAEEIVVPIRRDIIDLGENVV